MVKCKIFERSACERSWETLSVNPFKPRDPRNSRALDSFRLFSFIVNMNIFIWLYNSFKPDHYKLFGYLTNWSLILSIIYFPCALFGQKLPSKSKAIKYLTIFGEITTVMEFLIGAFFWLALFPLIIAFERYQFLDLNVCLHLVVPLTVWIDVLYNRLPFPRHHFWAIMLFGNFYLGYNYVWTMITNDPPYPVIDWKGPLTLISVLVCYCIVIGSFALARWQFIKKYESSEEKKLLLTPEKQGINLGELEAQVKEFPSEQKKIRSNSGDSDLTSSKSSQSTNDSEFKSQRISIDIQD